MKKLSLLFIVSTVSLALPPDNSLRSLYLKTMQEPTGKNFLLFQKKCKAKQETLSFENDQELDQTLKPKKRHLGAHVHALVIAYRYCVDENSKKLLEETFATETLKKNLKKFISISCSEALPEEDLKRVFTRIGTSRDYLTKRLKTITIPGKCSEYKAKFELLVKESHSP